MREKIMLGLVVMCMGCAGVSHAQPNKKLIQFGWDMMDPNTLSEKIEGLEHLPFDGLTVRSKIHCYTFYNREFDSDAIALEVDAMTRMNWGKFTHNFMYMTAAARGHWFDDDAWSQEGHIIKNVRAIARIGQAGGCKGILFDPEFIYWGQPAGPWNYKHQLLHGQKSVDAYRAMVRKRGAQFMDAIEQEMPNPVFLSLFWAQHGFKNLPYDTDPKLINEVVGGEEYGLLHDFLVGMLDGADEGTILIDGNEPSYYANSADAFLEAWRFTHETMPGFVPENLRDKFKSQVQIAHAIYADVHSNTRDLQTKSTFMSPKERAVAMERIVYLALKNSDQYVWFYTEYPQYLTGVRVAPEMIPAIDRARWKVANNRKFGIHFEPIERRAVKAYHAAQTKKIVPADAKITRAASPPVLDGQLNDELWQKSSRLGPFQNFVTAVHPLETTTVAYMAYDNANLYIAFRSDDPVKRKLDTVKIDLDDEHRGYGDMVEIAIGADEQASSYYHLRLTYDGRRWDTFAPASVWPNEIFGKDSQWEGEYQTAIYVDPSFAFWSIEVAIPWQTLNRTVPDQGDRILGNLMVRTDRRPSHAGPEFASWSLRRRNRIVEAKTLGTWVFK